MHNLIKVIMIILTFCLFNSCAEEFIVDTTADETLNRVIDSEFKFNRMPGMAYVAVNGDSIVLMDARGYANVAEKKIFTPQTRMEIASISKTIIATAIMQLHEAGVLNIDSSVNQYLPFKVVNPFYPNDFISLRMLLTHTSSISDVNQDNSLIVLHGYEDYPQSINDYLHDYLVEGGQYYSKESYSNIKPGESYDYSNIGATLLALVVEQVSGTDYNNYCKVHIFEPLGMNRTTFFYSETPKEEMAIPYLDVNDLNPENPFNSYPDYPDGHLITTVEDLSKFLRAYIMDGIFNGYQLLKPSTIQLMLTPNQYDFGLIWYTSVMANTSVWRHNGGWMGISTEMRFDPITKTGIIVFINRTGCYPETLFESLHQYAKKQ